MTNKKDRLSKDDIERMMSEGEEFAAEDEAPECSRRGARLASIKKTQVRFSRHNRITALLIWFVQGIYPPVAHLALILRIVTYRARVVIIDSTLSTSLHVPQPYFTIHMTPLTSSPTCARACCRPLASCVRTSRPVAGCVPSESSEDLLA